MYSYEIRKHRRYRGGDVLESVATYSAPTGIIGHHFVDHAEFTYHIVVKAP
ncbi:hypothetical protein I2483_13700 [Sporosarcina sp. E16_3]|uniref:hypothetical protein n=1 Tax=Sporosarcina sp. E16_3 TaxID=2789293 RepID=UPI001A92FE2A|nr:hypothetical protein [Sporosarcina sp. E16_3]MBO0602717.1 hypothetical protein [Sporosarcina sp. E16_3]